jgi:hypothetical protein
VLKALTVNRRWLALDPDPDPDGNQAAYRDGTGRWITRQLRKDQEPYRYERRMMPHVATCSAPRPRPAPSPKLPDNVIPITRARRRT